MAWDVFKWSNMVSIHIVDPNLIGIEALQLLSLLLTYL